MNRYPDEVEEGLNCCGTGSECCKCPYNGRYPHALDCLNMLIADAAEYIQQLKGGAAQ